MRQKVLRQVRDRMGGGGGEEGGREGGQGLLVRDNTVKCHEMRGERQKQRKVSLQGEKVKAGLWGQVFPMKALATIARVLTPMEWVRTSIPSSLANYKKTYTRHN